MPYNRIFFKFRILIEIVVLNDLKSLNFLYLDLIMVRKILVFVD